MMDTAKTALRRRLLEARKALDPVQAEEQSRLVCRRVSEHPAWQAARRVLVYMPHRGEVDLRPLMENAWLGGKEVVLPRSVPAERSLLLYRVDSLQQLAAGAYGIAEPPEDPAAQVDPAVLDLALVPGVAFDRAGYRLGYGGGYYDRFFAGRARSLARIGAAYSFQLVPTVHPESHDQPMDGVVTPDRWVVPHQGRSTPSM